MIKIIKHYWTILKDKSIYSFKNTTSKGRNVYNMKHFGEEMTFVHRILKKLFIVPASMFFKWFFGDKLKKTIDKDYQFRKLKVFDEAVERALVKWATLYQPYAYGKYIKPEVFLNNGASLNIRFFKEMYNTVNHADTAYLEFHNFLMDEIYKGMSNMEKGHLLYTSKSIKDFRYFRIVDGIQNGKITLVEEKL